MAASGAGFGAGGGQDGAGAVGGAARVAGLRLGAESRVLCHAGAGAQHRVTLSHLNPVLQAMGLLAHNVVIREL
jgi:hypothetical protein